MQQFVTYHLVVTYRASSMLFYPVSRLKSDLNMASEVGRDHNRESKVYKGTCREMPFKIFILTTAAIVTPIDIKYYVVQS
jgi:hypothetical protein